MRKTRRRTAASASLALSVMFGAAASAAPPPPIAPAVSDGNYTVTTQGCYAGSSTVFCAADWLEERVEPNGQYAYTTGNYTDKPPGTYQYRSGVVYCSVYIGECTTQYSAAVTVVVGGDLPTPDTLEEQARYRFRVKAGHVVGNSRKDILIERVAGGVPGNGVVDAVVLEQLGQGQFRAVVPSAAQRGSAAWSAAPVEIALEDINVDGFVDVVAKNVDSVVAGADDQIVFSSGRLLDSRPIGVRALDAALRAFVANVLDYIVDNDYFTTHAPAVYVSGSIPQLYCPGQVLYGIESPDLERFLECYSQYVYVYGVIPDYTGFNQKAVGIWSTEAALANGEITRQAALRRIAEAIEDMLGVAVGGWGFEDVYGPDISVPNADDRRGLELFLAVLGIANANAQEIDTQEAPRQLALDEDVIYLLGRYVFGNTVEKLHTSLYYRVPGLGAPTWLSAFDSDDRALFDGTLEAELSDPRDAPPLMRLLLAEVQSDLSLPAYAYFFGELVPAHNHYRSLPSSLRAPYDAIPELPPCGGCAGRNSNGYINGLIQATNGHPVISHRSTQYDLSRLTGWEFPVEAHYFGR